MAVHVLCLIKAVRFGDRVHAPLLRLFVLASLCQVVIDGRSFIFVCD